MRVSTAYSYDNAIANLQKRNNEMATTQMQMTTGKRVNVASDDPVAAARAERAAASISRVDADKRTADASKNSMTLTESALGQAVELMQQARETMVQAGNGSYSDSERKALAAKLKEVREQLFAIANRSDGNGAYLFGGQGSASPPFVDAPGGVQFVGQGGQNQVVAGEIVPLSTDGQSIWLQARSGNGVFETSAITQTGTAWVDAGSVNDPSQLTGHDYTLTFTGSGPGATYDVVDNTTGATVVSGGTYTSGRAIVVDGMSFTISGEPAVGDSFGVAPAANDLSIFETMDNAIAALSTPNLNSGQIQQGINRSLRDIDNATNRIASARSAAGETLNRLDGVSERLDAQALASKTEKSNAEDLDMVQAISDFQNIQTGYNAALQTYSMVQRMSLFNYINT